MYYYTAYLTDIDGGIVFELPFVYGDIKTCAQQFYEHYSNVVVELPLAVEINGFGDIEKYMDPNCIIYVKKINVS
jgi:hypothetical protein